MAHYNSTAESGPDGPTNEPLHYQHHPYLIAAPGVIVALSSVLLDASLPRAESRLTIQVQVLLCAGLQHAAARSLYTPEAAVSLSPYGPLYDLISTCVYITIFLSMVSAATTTAALRNPGGQWKRLEKHARSLPAASLVPLFYALTLLRYPIRLSKSLLYMAAAFFGALLALSLERKRRSAQEGRFQSLAGIPIVGGGDRSLHRDKWNEWSPLQVMEWASTLPDESLHGIAWRLVSEKIDGTTLGVVTTDDLISFGIPYGYAVRLRRHIDELCTSSGGEGGRYATRADDFDDAEQWLNSKRPSSSRVDERIAIDPRASGRAKQLFKDRFGMELPEMRLPKTALDDGANGSRGAFRVEDCMGKSPVRAGTNSNLSESSNAELDNAVLASMPPDVRDIASRRPDLVRTLLESQSRKNDGINEGNWQQQNVDEATSSYVSQSLPQRLNPAMVESMPPHIREIVSRRPDLVDTMLESGLHDEKLEQTKPSYHLSSVQQALMNNTSSDRFVSAQAAADVSGLHTEGPLVLVEEAKKELATDWADTEIGDDDTETVHLLRRRPNR